MSGDPEYDRLAGWAAILAGIGGFVYSVAFIIGVAGALQNWIGNLGIVVGILLILIYLGRLIILSPTNLLVAGLAGLTGFILSPSSTSALASGCGSEPTYNRGPRIGPFRPPEAILSAVPRMRKEPG